MQQLIAQCDLNIERQLAAIADRTNPSQDSEPTLQLRDLAGYKPRKRKPKDGLELSLVEHLKRILGDDLTTIPSWRRRTQGKRAAFYGMTLLNRSPRTLWLIRSSLQKALRKLGFSEEMITDSWHHVRDTAVLKYNAESEGKTRHSFVSPCLTLFAPKASRSRGKGR